MKKYFLSTNTGIYTNFGSMRRETYDNRSKITLIRSFLKQPRSIQTL